MGLYCGHMVESRNNKADAQISSISRRIIEQTVTFLGKEEIKIGDKIYKTMRFNFKSSDETLPDSKKLNTDIWYEGHIYGLKLHLKNWILGI